MGDSMVFYTKYIYQVLKNTIFHKNIRKYIRVCIKLNTKFEKLWNNKSRE